MRKILIPILFFVLGPWSIVPSSAFAQVLKFQNVKDQKFYKEVSPLIDKFIQGLLHEEGEKWEKMCDPNTGFIFRYLGSYATQLDCLQLGGLFQETKNRWWGRQDGSGAPIKGNFKKVWYSQLSDVAKHHDTRGINVFVHSGNIVDRLIGKDPFVDLTWSGPKDAGGMGWQSIRLFFIKDKDHWFLHGIDIYHWTI